MLKQSKPYPPKLAIMWLLVLLFLSSLACSLGSESSNIIRIKTLGQLSPSATEVTLVESSAEVVVEENLTSTQPTNASITPKEISSDDAIAPTPTPLPAAMPAPETQAAAESSTQQSESASALSNAAPDTTLKEHKPSLAFVPLPKSNPTSTSSQPAAPAATATPPPAPTAIAPIPDTPPEETEPVPPMVKGWSFVGVRASLDQEDSIVVGELVNNTGIPQTNIYVSGTFYGKNNHIIDEEIDTLSYVPVEVVPVGAHVPFELMIESQEPIIRLDLYAMSEPSGGAPNQDFQFSNVNQWMDTSNLYCLDGQIENVISQLEDYLIILASGYDNQGQLISFGEYAVGSPQDVFGDKTSPFEMCIDPLDKQIAHYELRALGR